MLQTLELTAETHRQLVLHCKKRNIGFFSTAFDIQSLDYLVALGAERFKVPSGEITNFPYLRQVSTFGKPIILSTGMATLGEIESAIDVLTRGGVKLDDITVLHCTTEYPAPMCDVNLLAMISIRDAFHVSVGYSDHTLGIEVPIAAVGLGATVIEKHLTLNRRLRGPDHLRAWNLQNLHRWLTLFVTSKPLWVMESSGQSKVRSKTSRSSESLWLQVDRSRQGSFLRLIIYP